MKKKMFLAGALIALMAVGAFAQTYTAESNFEVRVSGNAVTILKYVGGPAISEVNIPPTIQNLPVTTITSGAFSNNWVTSITIPASVTSIQMTACYALPRLTSVTFLGTIPSSGITNAASFPGDLRAKFYATDRTNGTPGTYTRSGETWTLTPAAATTTTSAQNSPNDFEYSQTADRRGIIIAGYKGTATTVRIPDRINNLPVVEIGADAFNPINYQSESGGLDRVNSITSIIIPNTVTTIGRQAFMYLDKITSITLPTSLTAIGSSAFSSMSALTSISLPASIRTIGGQAFFNCPALTTVTIPASVTRITFGTATNASTNVFQNCTSLNAATKTALQRVGYTGTF